MTEFALSNGEISLMELIRDIHLSIPGDGTNQSSVSQMIEKRNKLMAELGIKESDPQFLRLSNRAVPVDDLVEHKPLSLETRGLWKRIIRA